MNDVTIPLDDGGHINVWHRPAHGRSPTAVLIHGLTGTSRWWARVIAHLPDDLGLIAPDIRGRGNSWDSPGPYGLETVSEDIALVLDHFDIGRITAAGYSMGAWAAALFARHHPKRVERVVMVDGGLPIPYDDSLTTDELLDRMVGPSLQRLQMTFSSPEDYVAYYKSHPAFGPLHDVDLAPILHYELVARSGDFKVKANRDAVITGGADMTINPEVVTAGLHLEVPAHVLVVDHGMFGQPGGFTPIDVTTAAAAKNDKITFELVKGLNHYTLIFGEGAPHIAAAVIGSD